MRALAIPGPAAALEARYRATARAAAARRHQALGRRKKGLRAAAAAGGTSAETRRRWVKRAATEGLAALAGRKAGSGAKPKLDPARQEQVLAWGDAEPRPTPPAPRRRIAAARGIDPRATQGGARGRARGGRRAGPRKRPHP